MNVNPLPTLQSIAAKVATRSVLNSLLWTFAISIAGVFALAFVVPAFLAPYLYIAPATSLGMIFLWFCFFALTDPDRLQTEELQFKQSLLKYLGDHHHDKGIAAVDLTPVPNPVTEVLPVGTGDVTQ